MELDRTLARPKNLVLDFMRVARSGPIPVKVLVSLGELFDSSENAMRVAITRLTAEGKLTHDERGFYELTPTTDPVTSHIEAWRLGEGRVRPWCGDWLSVALPRGAHRSARRRSIQACTLFGFREGLEATWVRPDNLALESDRTFALLRSFGLEDDATTFVASALDGATDRSWRKLWNVRGLEKTYAKTHANVTMSAARVDELDLEDALAETFLIGGAAIRVLATDPLLPDEINPCVNRAALFRAMSAYDVLGRRLWLEWLSQHIEPEPAPEDYAKLSA